jgi:hypothetical protein
MQRLPALCFADWGLKSLTILAWLYQPPPRRLHFRSAPERTTCIGAIFSVVSLLALLAQKPEGERPPRPRYDSARQVSQVWERGQWVDSWLAETPPRTKKADLETGEDSKGG